MRVCAGVRVCITLCELATGYILIFTYYLSYSHIHLMSLIATINF